MRVTADLQMTGTGAEHVAFDAAIEGLQWAASKMIIAVATRASSG
jgi:hypothetical protein